MRERYDTLPAGGRLIVQMLGLSAVAALVAMLVVLVLGQFDAFHLSNAFFFAAAILFMAALVVYWTRPMQAPAEPQAPPPPNAPAEPRDPLLRRRARRRSMDIPPLTVALFLSGMILFGLSVLVGLGI